MGDKGPWKAILFAGGANKPKGRAARALRAGRAELIYEGMGGAAAGLANLALIGRAQDLRALEAGAHVGAGTGPRTLPPRSGPKSH